MKQNSLNFLIIGLWSLVVSLWSLVWPKVILSQSPTSTTVGEVIDEKIKNLREGFKEKAQEALNARPRRGLAGNVKTVTDGALTVETTQGERLVILNEGTTFIKKENLKIGAYVIVIGDLNSDTSLEAKRVVVTAKPKLISKKIVIGQLVDICNEENLLTLKNEKKNQVTTVEVKETTIITKKDGNSVKKVTFKALTVGDWLVVIGTPAVSDEKMLTAKLIHAIPGKTVTPTPSPTPSP